MNDDMTNDNLPQTGGTASPKLVLSTSRTLGFFKSVPCYLVFYENEMILAHLSKQVQNQAIEQYRQEQKDQGKGVLRTMVAMAGIWNNYGQRYYQMPKEDILKQDSMNTALPYAAVTSVLFKTAREYQDTQNAQTGRHPGKLHLQTATEKFRFQHQYFDSRKNIKSLLEACFGNKLTYKARLFSKTIHLGGNPNSID
jgi:hypothetical protein